MFSAYVDACVRWVVKRVTDFLPVKVIRDDSGVPFLYRYHLLMLTVNGPGLCIHHFVKSDPERGHHDHPWGRAISFILSGGYSEQILTDDKQNHTTVERKRWHFNYLDGNLFHRVMLDEEQGQDAWTLFAFQRRSKTWSMVGLDKRITPMSTQIDDQDGGWWHAVMKGLGVYAHLPHAGNVEATVDAVVFADSIKKVLLIKRGKEPFKGQWAFPGGRVEQRDTDLLEAVQRELREETSLKDVVLRHVDTVGNNTRDPRGFCLTCVFVAKLPGDVIDNIRAGDDAVDYMWANVSDPPEMAFDHAKILEKQARLALATPD